MSSDMFFFFQKGSLLLRRLELDKGLGKAFRTAVETAATVLWTPLEFRWKMETGEVIILG